VVAPRVVQQGRRLDPAVSAHKTVLDVPGLEQADQEGSRDVHQVGRLLSGEFGVRRHQGHRLARGHVGQNTDQEVNGCAGDGDRLAVFLDLNRTGLWMSR
jgi:hypothetical protein